MEKKSLLKKLIDKLKNTALFNIFLNPEAGMVVPSEDLSSGDSIEQLSNATGMSIHELTEIEIAFNKAAFSLEGIKPVVNLSPANKDESANPFKVDPSTLHQPAGEHPSRNSNSERGIDRCDD